MMSIYPILIVGAVLLSQQYGMGDDATWQRWLWAWGPVGLIVAAVWLAQAVGVRRMDLWGSKRGFLLVMRALGAGRWLLLGNHIYVLMAQGWLGGVRAWLGDGVLYDEVVAILPPVVGLILLWRIQVPVDRRLRSAMLIRRLESGVTLPPEWGTWGMVWFQVRTNLLLLLVPILLIVGLAELVERLLGVVWGLGRESLWNQGLSIGCGLLVFLFSPFIARVVLMVERFPEGEAREALEAVCTRHGVRVRDLLLWRTGGMMINAAVMGLLGRLRFVLLSDALMEQLPKEEVIAVMAHEIGHIRHRHLPWMMVTLVGLLFALSLVSGGLMVGFDALGLLDDREQVQWIEGALTIAGLSGLLVLFGFVSRRYERQADTFAVEHLSEVEHERATVEFLYEEGEEKPGLEEGRLTARAVVVMQSALERIAGLNGVARERRSWRHGSIGWRQRYLGGLVGAGVDSLVIDRTVRRLKLGALLLLLVSVLGLIGFDWYLGRERESGPVWVMGENSELVESREVTHGM